MVYISFITTVKIAKNYEDYGHRIRLYIENISQECIKRKIDYEILISEDVCKKNVQRLSQILSDDFLKEKKVKILVLQQTYFNPFNKNMLESPNKNLCIKHSKGKFLCITSGDVLMNDKFFYYLKHLQNNCFYRFLSYSIKKLDIPIENAEISYVINYCNNNIIHCVNDKELQRSSTIDDIALKSGNIMVMDRNNWIRIGGFPECGIFNHTDLVVCMVVANNKIKIQPILTPIKTFEIVQSQTSSNNNILSEQKEAAIAMKFKRNIHCNPQSMRIRNGEIIINRF